MKIKYLHHLGLISDISFGMMETLQIYLHNYIIILAVCKKFKKTWNLLVFAVLFFFLSPLERSHKFIVFKLLVETKFLW